MAPRAGANVVARPHRSWTPLAHAVTATGDQWTLRIVLALGTETVRLNHLQARLPGISAATLARQLHHMDSLGLLTRERFREAPPRVLVTPTQAGIELLPVAGALARWGMRNLWGAPAADERVDVGCLLQSLPALIEGAEHLGEGIVETAVLPDVATPATAAHRGLRRHVFRVRGATVEAAGEPDSAVTARVEGTQAAWVAALGPVADCAGLRFSGDEPLARRLLDALPRGVG